MKKFIVLSAALMSVFYYTNAKADVLIEPYIGYHLDGKLGEDEAKFSGTGIGGRIGYQNLGFMLGLNLQRGNLEIDEKGYDEFELTTYGAFIGYNLPILLRFWGEYIVGGSGTAKTSVGDIDLEKMGGYRLGVGFTGLPFVSINLEMSQVVSGEQKLPAGMGGSTSKEDADINSYLLSISLPITL